VGESAKVSLSEKDYLGILGLINKFNECETKTHIKECIQFEFLPLFEATTAFYAWTDPEIKQFKEIEGIVTNPAYRPGENEWKLLYQLLPTDPIIPLAIKSSRSVVAYDVDLPMQAGMERVDKLFKDLPQESRDECVIVDKVKTGMVALDLPDLALVMGIHRHPEIYRKMTLRDVRMLELLWPHLQHSIKTIFLSAKLAQYQNLAEEALNDIDTAVTMVREGGMILFRNSAFEKLFNLSAGQFLPKKIIEQLQNENLKFDPPFDIDHSKIELPFLELEQGIFRLSFSRLKNNILDDSPCWLLRMKPAIEPYAKMNFLMKEAGLTGREMEISTLVKDGIDDQDIASRLFISLHTVKNHLKSIHKKLDVHTRPQLVALLNQTEKK
jgi:DNA-binding CsgD family transcriptional regulator